MIDGYWEEVNYIWMNEWPFGEDEATFRDVNDVLPEDYAAVPLYVDDPRVMVLRWTAEVDDE